MTLELSAIFSKLTTPDALSGIPYSTQVVPGFDNLRIAKSQDGLPALLVGHNGDATAN